MAFIIDGNVSNKYPKLGGREFFIGGGGRINNIYVSGSVVVGG